MSQCNSFDYDLNENFQFAIKIMSQIKPVLQYELRTYNNKILHVKVKTSLPFVTLPKCGHPIPWAPYGLMYMQNRTTEQ